MLTIYFKLNEICHFCVGNEQCMSPQPNLCLLLSTTVDSSKNVDPHSLTSIIAFSFKGIENACYTIVGRNQFSEQLLYKEIGLG